MHESVTVHRVANLPGGASDRAVRIVRDPVADHLLVLTNSGNIYAFDPSTPSSGFDLIYTRQDHGAPRTGSQSSWGMDVGPDGTIYILGNEDMGTSSTRAVIRRGVPQEGGQRQWSTVASTEAYSLSRTWFDHRFSAVVVSPDGRTLYVNSGSRTDHGEMYNGIREEGLTAAIFQIPADGDDLVLPNDRDALSDLGYVFAEGTRNTYDLAFGPHGHLFGPDNAGDRDDSEELNWLREGDHYGFPWRAGTNDNPQQYPGYDPADDPLVLMGRNPLNQADTGWYFSNDPTFPSRPDVDFVDPIPNWGPDANLYRDEETGHVVRASDIDAAVGSFTGHRSPLGLVFDRDSLLASPFAGGGFVLSFNSDEDEMLRRLGGHGEDMLHLDLFMEDGAYHMNAYRIVEGFNHPIDAEIIGNRIFVIEYGNPYSQFAGSTGLHVVTLPGGSSTSAEHPPVAQGSRLIAYPNPFRSSATVEFSHADAGHVRAVLYDLLGREIRILVDGYRGPGTLTMTLDAQGLPAGRYLLRVTSEGRSEVVGLVRLP
jgi:hypothetical protein